MRAERLGSGGGGPCNAQPSFYETGGFARSTFPAEGAVELTCFP